MIKNLLKELENIKDIKSKKAFLETALKSYSEKKTIEKIKSMIEELEKIEKENSKSKFEADNDVVSQRLEFIANVAPRMTIAEVEEAPKYEPNVQNDFGNQPRRDSNSRSLEDITNNSNINSKNMDNERPLNQEISREDNLTDYIASFANSSSARATNVKVDYKNPNDLRRSLERIDLDKAKNQTYVSPIMRNDDYVVNTPEERDNLRWTSNIEIDKRRFSDVEDSKYSADVVENIKKQKKHFEKEYI